MENLPTISSRKVKRNIRNKNMLMKVKIFWMRWIQFCSWEVKIIMIESKSKLRKKAIRKVQKMKDQENKIN